MSIPATTVPPPPVPRAPRMAARLARALLRLFGWRVDVPWPPFAKAVVVVYPHTSNWDFVIGYLAKTAVGLPVLWIGKDTLFRWPVAGLLRRMGGIPVNRRERTGLIGQLSAVLERRPQAWIAIAPEGTRAFSDHWKSGFYRLALAADVPVGLAWIDYWSRTVGLTTYLRMTGDTQADLARIRAAYAGKIGRRPLQASDIRLKPE